MEYGPEPQDGVEAQINRWPTGRVQTAPRETCTPKTTKPFLRKVDTADFVRDVTYVSGRTNELLPLRSVLRSFGEESELGHFAARRDHLVRHNIAVNIERCPDVGMTHHLLLHFRLGSYRA
jgi:hypothetical protein